MISSLSTQSSAMQMVAASQPPPPPPPPSDAEQSGTSIEGVGSASGAEGSRPPPPPPPPPDGESAGGADAESLVQSLFDALDAVEAEDSDLETSDAVTDLLTILEKAAEDGYSSSLSLFAA
ncbi:MAG: hypothetical protein ACSHWY_08200 [Octadecabacter sp.]